MKTKTLADDPLAKTAKVSLLSQLAPLSRLLVPSKRHSRPASSSIAVDSHSSSLKRVRDADGAVEVLGEDGRVETVRGVVGAGDDLVLGHESVYARYGAEDFFAHDPINEVSNHPFQYV